MEVNPFVSPQEAGSRRASNAQQRPSQRPLYLVLLLVIAGCSPTVKHEVTVADVERDKARCSELVNKLMSDIDGAPDATDPKSESSLVLTRLRTYHAKYMKEVTAGNLRTAAPKFLSQIEGKALAQLAAEQRAEDAKLTEVKP
jgi:hypothetical protein